MEFLRRAVGGKPLNQQSKRKHYTQKYNFQPKPIKAQIEPVKEQPKLIKEQPKPVEELSESSESESESSEYPTEECDTPRIPISELSLILQTETKKKAEQLFELKLQTEKKRRERNQPGKEKIIKFIHDILMNQNMVDDLGIKREFKVKFILLKSSEIKFCGENKQWLEIKVKYFTSNEDSGVTWLKEVCEWVNEYLRGSDLIAECSNYEYLCIQKRDRFNPKEIFSLM